MKVVHFDLLKPYQGPQRPRWTKKLMDDRQEEQRRKAVRGQACGEERSQSEDESSGAETDSGSDED